MEDGSDFEPLDKALYEEREIALREALLDAQFDYKDNKTEALLILINGPDGSGKGEVLNRLNEWLDPRGVVTMAYDINDPDEFRYPGGWRYWNDMPARGKVGIVLGSWYHHLLLRRAKKDINRSNLLTTVERINRVEAMLGQEQVRVIKIWLSLSADSAAERFRKKLKGPGSFKRPLLVEWGQVHTKKELARIVETAEEIKAATGPQDSPWHSIPSSDPMTRDLAVGNIVLEAMRAAPATLKRSKGRPPSVPRRISRSPSVLAELDLSQTLEKSEYKNRLRSAQKKLYKLTRKKSFKKRGMVLVFEGNDAAGKGGAIRRMTTALNPIHTRVHPIAAPSEEALAHPYLWRFWLRMPERGDTAIFDRSWYGRVLVERVEGFATRADWRRAYQEINDFEHLIHGSGFIVHKFWLSIDAEEQLRRFEARQETPHKRHKITDEDWRNREKWDLYTAAVDDMVNETSNAAAPWTLVEANDKRFARVKVLETICDRLEAEL